MAVVDVGDFLAAALHAVDAFRPAQFFHVLAAAIFASVLLNQRAEVDFLFHGSTMPKKRKRKHATKMTTNEAVKHLFHPDVVAHVKKHAHAASKPRKKGA